MLGTDLTKGRVSKTLLRFTLPFLVSNLLHTLYGIVDLYIVGRFTDAAQMSAVSIGSLLMMMLNCLIMGFGTGGTVVIGQFSGAKREKEVHETIATAFCVYPVLAVCVMALCLLFCRPLLQLINTPPESLAAAEAYFTICLFGLVFTGMFVSIAAVLRGLGDSTGPTVFVTVSCICNVVGDYLCVAVWNMGAAGAALATSVSQGISVLAGFLYLKYRRFPFDFRPRSFRIQRDRLRQLMTVGTPIAFQEILVNLTFLVLEAIINKMGYVVSASAGVADRLFGLAVVPALAFSQAISAMVAQNTGAREYARGRRSLRIGLLCSGAVGVLVFAVMALFPAACIGLFTAEPDVIRSGVEYMTFYKFDMLLCTVVFCINGYINGTGHARYTLVVNLVSSFCVRLPMVWFLSRAAGATLYTIGLGLPTATVVQIALAVGFLLFSKSERAHRAAPELRS